MTGDEKAVYDAAAEWMARYEERKDHAMRHWAYEGDAYIFAQFILTGRYIKPETRPAAGKEGQG